MPDGVTIALAGNPNSGKTTLFNTLTGSRQQVGNYPGITVDKREGFVSSCSHTIHIVDLPGTYSLTAYSQEELVARNFLIEERPSAVVAVLDATNLERNLYLTVQFLELGIPMVLALNMMDEVRSQGMEIDSKELSRLLRTPVVETVARIGQGKQELIDTVLDTACDKGSKPWQPLDISYGPDLDGAIQDMQAIIEESGFLAHLYPAKWLALKYLELDQEVTEKGRRTNPNTHKRLKSIADAINRHCQQTLNTDPEAIIADYRYGFITSLLRQNVLSKKDNLDRINITDQLDKLLTHRLLGPIIMFLVLYGMFEFTFGLGEAPLGWMQDFFAWLGQVGRRLLPEGMLQSLVVSGIIDGVGGVLSFVPLILVMFFGLSFLEDSGYMARMAYMLDRVFRTFGLHGCSVMPFIISGGIPGGCAVPGLMATRTLRSPKEKMATLLTAPFLSCGAKVPVFLLIGGAFFPNSAAQVLFWITLSGWLVALVVAWLLRNTIIRGEATPFVMELPPYRLPTLKGLCIHTWERGWQYIKKAGTVILAISIVIWAAMSFPGLSKEKIKYYETKEQKILSSLDGAKEKEKKVLNEKLKDLKAQKAQAAIKNTVAGRLGCWLEPVSKWAGFDWRTNIALIGGVAAKEVIVSTLGTAYSLGQSDEVGGSLSKRLAQDPKWNKATGLSVMVFVLLYAPCFVSLVAMAKESSWKWAGFALVFNTLIAFLLAVGIFQLGLQLMN